MPDDPRPTQSGYAALIDLAVIAAIVALAVGKVSEPAAWTLLGGIVSGRFGVSLGKTIERVKMGGGGGGGDGDGGGGYGRPSSSKMRTAKPADGSSTESKRFSLVHLLGMRVRSSYDVARAYVAIEPALIRTGVTTILLALTFAIVLIGH